MFNLLFFKFRFRGKVNRLLDLYDCFRANEHRALHPTQLARLTGHSFAEVNTRLSDTPELFVKLPRRPDGITRYRVTSAMSALPPEEVEAIVKRHARRETWLLYAGGFMFLCVLLIVLSVSLPAMQAPAGY